ETAAASKRSSAPRAAWIACAASAVVAAGAFLFPVASPPILSAAELLTRSEESAYSNARPARHRVVWRSPSKPMAVEVWSRDSKQRSAIRGMIGRVPVDPENPLDPRRFRKWHDGLRKASDTIVHEADRITIRTTADASSFVKIGTITL